MLLVLSSWAAFVVPGLAFAKTTEHAAANAAYTWVQVAAALGTLTVLLGVALVAQPLAGFLRVGGWQTIHRPYLRAIGATGLTVVAFVPLVIWAHHLTNAQRNGGDRLYTCAFLVVVAMGRLDRPLDARCDRHGATARADPRFVGRRGDPGRSHDRGDGHGDCRSDDLVASVYARGLRAGCRCAWS